jgi:C_GCAxxG_C_C family probable redox protein
MGNANEAVARFKDGYACSQAVFCTYGEDLGIDHQTALKVSAAFAGGMRVGATCGAVTGALMAIGLKSGTASCEKISGRKVAYALTQRFHAAFLARHPSLLCKDLLGADLGTPEGRSIAESQDMFRLKCPMFVASAAEILEDLFKE